MANSKRTLFLKRRLRVRNKLRKVNAAVVRVCPCTVRTRTSAFS